MQGILWNSECSRDEWEGRISRVRDLVHHLEVETVRTGLRRCGLRRIQANSLPKVTEGLAKRGLHFTVISPVMLTKGFEHREVLLNEKDGNAGILGAICRDTELGEWVVQLHQLRNDKEIGALLGYPSCCIEFFSEMWNKRGITDPIWFQAANSLNSASPGATTGACSLTVCGDPRCNVALRYFGIRSVPHLPHSYFCQGTAVLADQWLALASEINPEACRDLKTMLCLPYTWVADHGQGEISTQFFRGVFATDKWMSPHTVKFAPGQLYRDMVKASPKTDPAIL